MKLSYCIWLSLVTCILFVHFLVLYLIIGVFSDVLIYLDEVSGNVLFQFMGLLVLSSASSFALMVLLLAYEFSYVKAGVTFYFLVWAAGFFCMLLFIFGIFYAEFVDDMNVLILGGVGYITSLIVIILIMHFRVSKFCLNGEVD